ncbi:class I SAM-dependent methyltransferase, partial [Glaciimonas sp. CA11.2]
SWYRPHLEKSLELIQRAAIGSAVQIIDVGGGEATLVDDLLANGYRNISVLDISQTAIDVSRQRLGKAADNVAWLVGDITQIALPQQFYDVWHDRAVFHFLTRPEQRVAYVRQVMAAMKPGGTVIVATFGPEGPETCSGLDIVRYDSEALHDQFGARFRLVESGVEVHQTPFGTTQQFLYCYCKMDAEST